MCYISKFESSLSIFLEGGRFKLLVLAFGFSFGVVACRVALALSRLFSVFSKHRADRLIRCRVATPNFMQGGRGCSFESSCCTFKTLSRFLKARADRLIRCRFQYYYLFDSSIWVSLFLSRFSVPTFYSAPSSNISVDRTGNY